MQGSYLRWLDSTQFENGKCKVSTGQNYDASCTYINFSVWQYNITNWFIGLFIVNNSWNNTISETFEEHSILTKYKEGDNFNHRNTFKYFED